MAKALSPKQRDLLIEHIDGKVPVDRRNALRLHAFDALLRAGLLRPACAQEISAATRLGLISRPRETALTEAGREAVAEVLAEYAEVLVRAGIEDIAQIKGLKALLRRRLPKVHGPASEPLPVRGNEARPRVK